jgi:hypothetical protein
VRASSVSIAGFYIGYIGYIDIIGHNISFVKCERSANLMCLKAANPWHWCDTLTTDYWNPPTSESQHARQRILAVIVAFILAAILAQAGW